MAVGKMRSLVLGMAAVAICMVAFESEANAFFGRECCFRDCNCCGIGLFRGNRCGCEDCGDCGDCGECRECCEETSDRCCRRGLFRRHRCCCSNGAVEVDILEVEGNSGAAPEKAAAGA